MSNGDSLDGFVFPPFIPPAAARPPQPPAPAAPAPVAEQPPAEPQASAPGRTTMPWDVETPIVRDGDDVAPAAADEASDEADDEDLPWLERPAPREPVAEAPAAAEAAPAGDAFPDWMAWDDRDRDEAAGGVADVSPVEGLEDFVPADDLGFIAAPPAMEWAEAAPADAADTSAWSLDAPEAVEPPPVAMPAAEVTFETPAAAEAEPAFDVTVDDGALTFAPAHPQAAAEPVAEPEPVRAADGPFVADVEAVMAAEPDPFTAASVHEAEAVAPAEPAPAAAAGVFDDVAARLEDIARTLRERPDELLSGAAQDPLALLVAGYVMGYGARR